MAEGIVTCSFTISNIEVIGSPVAKTVWNQFDEHGLIVGITRNKEEKNWSYRRRLFDTFVNQANSTYRGLINGITRELGLALYYPISIHPRLSPYTNRFYAPDPYIKISDAYIYLYSDYKNNVLDHQIDRYRDGGNYEKIEWLINFINTTTYFEAGLVSRSYRLDHSGVLINQTNRGEVIEAVQASTKFQLSQKYIVPGTIKFIDGSSSFRVEMRHINEVDRTGRFYIDYEQGIITVYSLPPVETTIYYQYNQYPFYPIASPIIINNLINDDFKVKLFEQILQDNGEYTHGLPTELGNDILNEILSVYPMYWGV